MFFIRSLKTIHARHKNNLVQISGVITASVLLPIAAHAAGSPWENAVQVLETSFTGPIARGLSLVSVVWGGLTFAFSEGGDSKRMLAGILFGVGMAIGAVNFIQWLFPS